MKIVFLTYVNRSGSTYLANLLSASNDICVCPEGDILVSLFLESPDKNFRLDRHLRTELAQILHSDRKLRSWGIEDDVFLQLEGINKNIDAFLTFLYYYQGTQKPDATSILFKSERLVDLCYDIERSKSEDIVVKYLSLIRDPRAVYASQKRTAVPGTGRKMSKNPVFTAIFWNHFARTNNKNLELIESHQILYHDLIQNMDETISGLSGYLEIDLQGISPGEGDLYGRLPDGYKPIHKYISEGPESKKINQWKEELNQEEIHLIERKCKKHLKDTGFEITGQVNVQLAGSTKVIYFTIIYQIVQFLKILLFHFKRIYD